MAELPDRSSNDASRKQFSCYQCKARKLKCDRVWPCQRCSHLGEDCEFPERRQRPGNVAKKPRVKELEARLATLEHRLKQPQAVAPTVDVHTVLAPNDGGVIPTGRLEQPPQQFIIDELTSLYFSRLYADAPMQDSLRYIASLRRPAHMQPPMCLQYAILSMAANLSSKYKELALPFYQRARNYAQYDEMKEDGRETITLGHAQCWVLLGLFEAQCLWFARASLSISRSVRLAQILGLYDVESGNNGFGLAPTTDWQEMEERRRTLWTIFCSDRLSSSTSGWHPLMDATQIRTLLPASEEAFQLGIEEASVTLHQALGDASTKLSVFAAKVLASQMLHECLEHTFREYPKDDAIYARADGFWEQHHKLDNRLAVLFMGLPNCARCPDSVGRPEAVLINLSLHTASMCIHRVGVARARGTARYEDQSRLAAVRLLSAAEGVYDIISRLNDVDALFLNPFVAFATYMAALVFLDDFMMTHSRHSEECLKALMGLMAIIASQNLITASLTLQLAQHMKKSGIDQSALEKVQHLTAKMEGNALPPGVSHEHTGAVIFCPLQPRLGDGF